MNRRTTVRVHEEQKGESHMEQTAMLTTASLLTTLLMTFHLTGRHPVQYGPAGLANLRAMFIFVALLCGTLLLAGRRAGYIIIFFGSVLGLVIPVIHMKGTRGLICRRDRQLNRIFLFCVDTPRVGITATFSTILSARALLSLPWRRSRRASPAA